MTVEFFWQLPVQGDGRALRPSEWYRGDYSKTRARQHDFARTHARRDGYTYFDHLVQIARAAELTGFDGVFIPQTAAGEEPLVVAGSLARELRRLVFTASLPAPFLSAVYAAKIATSFQRLSGGRLAWHLPALEPAKNAWHGQSWSVAEQIARINEFLDVVKGFWNEPGFTYHGRYYEVEKGGFAGHLAGQKLPAVHLSGLSEEAKNLSAKHGDVHVLALEPLPQLRGHIADLTARATAEGCSLRFAVEAHIIARPDAIQAWRDAREGWESHEPRLPNGTIPRGSDDAKFDKLIAADNLWTGFRQLRPGTGAGFVGGYDEVALRIAEYAAAGIDGFIFTANPHLEEAYRIGERVLPLVLQRLGGLRKIA